MLVGMMVTRSAGGNGRENPKRPQLSSTKRFTTPRVINILIINDYPPIISYYVSISLKGRLTYVRFFRYDFS